jgi:hypothetical protein
MSLVTCYCCLGHFETAPQMQTCLNVVNASHLWQWHLRVPWLQGCRVPAVPKKCLCRKRWSHTHRPLRAADHELDRTLELKLWCIDVCRTRFVEPGTLNLGWMCQKECPSYRFASLPSLLSASEYMSVDYSAWHMRVPLLHATPGHPCIPGVPCSS